MFSGYDDGPVWPETEVCNFSIFPGKGCRWLDSYSSHLTRFSAPLSSPLSEENQHEPVSERENNLIKVVGVLRPCFI